MGKSAPSCPECWVPVTSFLGLCQQLFPPLKMAHAHVLARARARQILPGLVRWLSWAAYAHQTYNGWVCPSGPILWCCMVGKRANKQQLAPNFRGNINIPVGNFRPVTRYCLFAARLDPVWAIGVKTYLSIGRLSERAREKASKPLQKLQQIALCWHILRRGR